VDSVTEEDIEDTEESVEELTLEARVVAQRIQELCNPETAMPVWDESKGEYRPCTYRDIVILLRSGKGVIEEYRQVLMEAGIPVYADSGKGYFDSVEVKNVLNMLSVIDNSRDDIALAGVLRSPLVGLREEQLAEIRCECRDRSLWDAMCAYMTLEAVNQQTIACLQHFQTLLMQWKEMKTYSTIRELIWSILKETGYYEYVAAMPHGTIRQANIYKLIEKASAYESTSYRGLFDFLRYIERVRVAQQDFGEATVLGANENLVQIMTIHKSKGLEFPVVIIGGCGRQFNQQDTKQPVLIDADGFLAVDDKHLEKHYFERTKKRECLKQHIKEEGLAEEMRVLYVAMTRAQEKLILVGGVKKTLAKQENYQLLYSSYQNRGDAQKRWICPGMQSTVLETENTDYEKRFPTVIAKSRLLKCNSYLEWLTEGIVQLQNQQLSNNCLEYRIITPELMDWQIGEEIDRMERAVQTWQERIQMETTDEVLQDVYERFQWRYPHASAATRKGKLSVSEIKRMSQVVDEAAQNAQREYLAAVNSDVNAGASYGTLIHLVMEHMPFEAGASVETVEAAVVRMKEYGILTEEELGRIPVQKIYKMLNSSLGLRMQAAEKNGTLHKEQQFVIGMPMNEVYADTKEEDLELIQGIIDAYFEEDDALILMDYKTDKVAAEGGERELTERYHAQLEYYKRTLEQLTGKQVRETYIYSFFLDKVIELVI
jgi:ATP-dependent helicase/nuclease subunit A